MLKSQKVLSTCCFMLLFASLYVLFQATASAADEYPQREVTVIIGFNAGGATDVIGRAIAKQMEPILGKPIVILNKAGAGGLLALNELVRSKPDGYTLMLSTATPLAAKQNTKDAPTLEDLEIISVVNLDSSAVLVKPSSRFKTLNEYFDAAQKNPHSIICAHAGVGGSYHLNAMVWQAATGARFKFVPYKGGAEIYPALAGGHVESASAVLPEGKQLIESGKVRALGVSSAKRHPDFPNVPTFKEQGYDLVWGACKFFVAPKGTPESVLNKFADALDVAMQSEALKEFWKTSGFEEYYLKRSEAIKYLYDAQKMVDKAYAIEKQ